MATNDTLIFLQDLLVRYDPNIDLSEGSRADSEVIQPILQRIGVDPFDNDMLTFVRTRVQQAFPDLDITELDPLTDTVLDPMRVLLEPVVRETKLVKLRSSIRNLSSLNDDEVDALMGNFFISRVTGGYAVGVVRIWFATPQTISLTQTNAASTRGGLRFMPSRPQAITADQMLLNVDGSEYYFDVNYTAESRGDSYNVEPNEIISIANLPTATRVRNQRRFRDGTPRETSLDFAARAQRSLSDKTLTVERGISSTLTEAFPAIRRLFSVGFRDPEMKRDVVTGGSLGSVPDDDINGTFYGTGEPVDDLDGDLTTPLLSASGAFISRLGAAGTEPTDWYVTLTYTNSTLVAVDVQVLEVVSDSQIRVDHEMPVETTPVAVTWILRQKTLSISDIPGGVTLPDSAGGTLELSQNEVHIGGKTDVYVAGSTDLATAQIDSLTDENPSAKGADAQTAGTDEVTLNDVSGTIEAGFSLVLEEGVDAGSYRILRIVTTSPYVVQLDTTMTGTQGSLAWKVVDDINVELTDPKDIKLEGDDMVTAAGNQTVSTSSAANFLDANVQAGDILELFDDVYGGEFVVEQVNAVTLVVTPAPSRTFTAIAYRVFRRSEAISTPLVRVRSMEILDASGAPSGTVIPYRDPVLSLSNAFQNEGSGVTYEARCRVGLVSGGVQATTGVFGVGSRTIEWSVFDKDQYWLGAVFSSSFTFSSGTKTAAQAVAELNADADLNTYGVKARVITSQGSDYVGLISSYLVELTGGTALAVFGWFSGSRNSEIKSSGSNRFTDAGVRQGDLLEVVDGNSAGIQGRILRQLEVLSGYDYAIIGSGPIGPEDDNGKPGLFNNVVLNPDVDSLVRIGRPSVGSARVYFLGPTSAEFRYQTTRFEAATTSATLDFRPDPENTRVVRPPPPLTELPNTGVATVGSPPSLVDSSADFLLYGVRPGDLLDVLYHPIDGTSALPSSGNIAFTSSNNVLRIQIGTDPAITISFPFPMTRQDAVDFINEQVGQDIASLNSGVLRLSSSSRIELDPSSTVITDSSNPLYLASAERTTDHESHGTFIISSVEQTVLWLSEETAQDVASTMSDTIYRIRRYVQRVSSTEMNTQVGASGLYYADVQMVSLTPGDVNNIAADTAFTATGVVADGYRLAVENPVLSYSRAEVVHAELSRSIILVGSPDDPTEAVQLSQQNVQVSYDRSQLVDEVQSFCDSNFQRVICEEILVRHLLPHYVSMTWNYAGGSSAADMLRAVEDLLDSIEPDEQLEVTDLTDVLRRRNANSVFTPDASSPTGRSAPLFLVVYHDEDRVIRGTIVKDYVVSVRTQRYIPDAITLTRISTSGIR